MFLLIEISLPACIFASYYFAYRVYVEYRLNEYDANKDGMWTVDEQGEGYQKWADAYYGGDGARRVFLIFFSVMSIFLGILYKLIFSCGDKLKSYFIRKYVK